MGVENPGAWMSTQSIDTDGSAGDVNRRVCSSLTTREPRHLVERLPRQARLCRQHHYHAQRPGLNRSRSARRDLVGRRPAGCGGRFCDLPPAQEDPLTRLTPLILSSRAVRPRKQNQGTRCRRRRLPDETGRRAGAARSRRLVARLKRYTDDLDSAAPSCYPRREIEPGPATPRAIATASRLCHALGRSVGLGHMIAGVVSRDSCTYRMLAIPIRCSAGGGPLEPEIELVNLTR